MKSFGWEAWSKADGAIMIEYADGTAITVKNDGITGYSFVQEYLREVSKHHSEHLEAADMILRRDFGDEYENMSRVPNIYNANLALRSLNCAFGGIDEVPDYNGEGEFRAEFRPCPNRATCRFNGYNPNYAQRYKACCNPFYETGLTPPQLRVAELLINTGLSNEEIAERLSLAEKSVRNHCTHIYERMGVSSRAELIKKLAGKRIK